MSLTALKKKGKAQEAVVRRAREQDAPFIHEAHMKSIREICSRDYTEEEIKAWGGREYLEDIRLSAIRDDFVWVVEKKGKVVGFGHMQLGVGINKDEGHIKGLYLTPEVLGQGLGQAIIFMMEEEAAKVHIKRMTLSSTLNALEFYRKNGYRELTGPTCVNINGTPVRCYPMEKRMNVSY